MRYVFGDYSLDLTQYELRHAGRLVPVEPRVFDLLAYLVQQAGQTVPTETLLAHLYPDQFAPVERLTNAVTHARKALGETSQAPRYIQTVRHRGYRFMAPVTVAPPPALDRPCPPAAGPPLPPHPIAGGAAPAPLVVAPSPTAVPAQNTAQELGAAGLDRPAAERRQVTILCCALAGSTALSGQLDPEDLREVLQVYRETCTTMIAHYGGHIDTFLGDGILVCFGYPQAHDDDPQRAVRAGLGIVEALVRVNPHIDQTWGVQLAVRLGIHTGLVVAGELGRGATRDPQAIVGEAPNIATRLQELAAPNTVVCSAATARLVEGYFPLETLSPQELTGVATPLPVYRVVDEPRVQTRFDVARTRGLTPLVGRASEVALLWERWAQAQDGQGQVVLLSGEAGIGKSRLVQAFTAQLTGEASAQIVCQCSPYAQQSAFAPLIAHLQRLLQLRLDDTPTEQLCRLETTLAAYALPLDEAVPLMAALLALPLPERYLPLPLTPQHQKQQTLATLLAWLLREAERQPVCMVFEDLHWVDPSTQEWLSLLIDQLPTARVLLLLLFRPEFQPPWAGRSYLTQLALGRLSPRQTEGMISQVVGGTSLPLEVLQQVVATTDGVPLFVEELTKMIVELGLVKEREGRYELTGPLPALAIPATLHDSLMARLDRLGPAKQIAQLGAVVGREFPYEMLQAMTPVDEAMVAQGLAQLVEVELLYQRGLPPRARYTFKHALMQEVAYNSVLLRRRQELHRAVGYAIEARYPGRLAEHYEALAHHFMHGARWSKALEYSTLAGDRAAEVFANVEANAHYSHALQATEQLTPPADASVVARLYAKQGAILEPLGEYEAAITAWERALALIRQTGERQEEIDILVGLSGIYNSAHREEPATRYSLHAVALARALNDRARLAVCLVQRAAIRSVAFGQLVEAIPEAEEALRLARDISEPKALAHTLVFLGSLLQWRAEFDRSLRYLREGVELAQQTHAGPLLGNAAFCIGHACAAQGAYEDALHWYQKLRDYAVAAGDTFWLARLPNTVGGVHLELFNSAEALRLNLEGEERAQQYASGPEPRGHSVVKAGLAYLQQGQHGHAEACFRRAETLVEADTWMRWRWHMVLLRAWGELALAQGRPDDAWTYACQSFALATRSHSRKHMVRAQLLQGEVFRVWGRFGEAAHTLEAAVHLTEQIGTPRERWLGQATLGTVLRQLGREQEGETYLTRATQTIEAIAAHIRTWPLRHSFLRATPVLAVYAALGHRPPPAML